MVGAGAGIIEFCIFRSPRCFQGVTVSIIYGRNHAKKTAASAVRASALRETLYAQLEQSRAQRCAKIFREKVTGARADRRELLKLLKGLTPGTVDGGDDPAQADHMTGDTPASWLSRLVAQRKRVSGRLVGCSAQWIKDVRERRRKRCADREKETPQEKLARRTANATVWIARFTVGVMLVGIFQYWVFSRQLGVMQGQLDEIRSPHAERA